MKTYDVAITITDVVSVDATSEDEAYALASNIFTENGLTSHNNYELDIIGVGELEE